MGKGGHNKFNDDPDKRRAIQDIENEAEKTKTDLAGRDKIIRLDNPELLIDISNSAYADLDTEQWLKINLDEYLEKKAKRALIQVWSKFIAHISAPSEDTGIFEQITRSFEWRVLFPLISENADADSPEWAGDLTGFNLCAGFSNAGIKGISNAAREIKQSGYWQGWVDIEPDSNELFYYLSRKLYVGSDASETTNTTYGNVQNIYTKIWMLGYIPKGE